MASFPSSSLPPPSSRAMPIQKFNHISSLPSVKTGRHMAHAVHEALEFPSDAFARGLGMPTQRSLLHKGQQCILV